MRIYLFILFVSFCSSSLVNAKEVELETYSSINLENVAQDRAFPKQKKKFDKFIKSPVEKNNIKKIKSVEIKNTKNKSKKGKKSSKRPEIIEDKIKLSGAQALKLKSSWENNYASQKPNFGFELAMTLDALENPSQITNNVPSAKMHALSLQFEYQPSFLQKLGVFGFGPSVELYPLIPMKNTSGNLFSNWSYGLQFRYQGRYIDRQPLVPVFAYQWLKWNYNIGSIGNGNFIARGTTLGLWLLLDVFDPYTARKLFSQKGISRNYLTLELRRLNGGDSNLFLDGESLFFGLRMER